MKLDTGSDVNMLHLDDFNSLQPRSQMKHTKVKLTAYKGEDIHVCEGTRSVSIETPRSQTNSLVRPMSVASAAYICYQEERCVMKRLWMNIKIYSKDLYVSQEKLASNSDQMQSHAEQCHLDGSKKWSVEELKRMEEHNDLLRLRSACSSRSIGRREASIYHGHWRSGGLHAS